MSYLDRLNLLNAIIAVLVAIKLSPIPLFRWLSLTYLLLSDWYLFYYHIAIFLLILEIKVIYQLTFKCQYYDVQLSCRLPITFLHDFMQNSGSNGTNEFL